MGSKPLHEQRRLSSLWGARPQPSSTHLGEEPPPLPVAQPEVGGAVPLEDFHGGQLLLPLGKCPAGEGHS